MTYTQDISVVYSAATWKLLGEQILSNILTDEERVLVINLIDNADTHLSDPDDNHILFFAGINPYEKDMKLLFVKIMDTLSVDRWYAVGLDTNGLEDTWGNWTDNPFNLRIAREIKSDDDYCNVWVSSGIKFVPQPITIPVPAGTMGCPTGPKGPAGATGPVVAVNDHTCKFCGNTSCSKSEKTCWKCGGVI